MHVGSKLIYSKKEQKDFKQIYMVKFEERDRPTEDYMVYRKAIISIDISLWLRPPT